MATHNGGQFRVSCSGENLAVLRAIQEQATDQGRGEECLAECDRFGTDFVMILFEFGEPLYSLPMLKMRIRHGGVRPLMVYYAVHDEKQWVVIKGFKLLTVDNH